MTVKNDVNMDCSSSRISSSSSINTAMDNDAIIIDLSKKSFDFTKSYVNHERNDDNETNNTDHGIVITTKTADSVGNTAAEITTSACESVGDTIVETTQTTTGVDNSINSVVAVPGVGRDEPTINNNFAIGFMNNNTYNTMGVIPSGMMQLVVDGNN